VKNNEGWTPLHSAAYRCHIDVVRVLLDHGADPTIRDNNGMTPLELGSKCSEEFREMLRRRSGATTVYE
jgi:ankyrin repeat protein